MLPPPEHFPLVLDAQRAQVGFVATTREALRAAPFLDARFMPSSAATSRVAVSKLRSALGEVSLPPAIFHTAFCCSTLLASALDYPGRVLALKEPDVLMQLANLPRVNSALRQDRDAFTAWVELTLRLLARRFDGEETVLLKPTNATANLLPVLATFEAPLILLYADLRAFLVSVIKKGEPGRWFVRHLMNIFRLDGMMLNQWQERERMLLTDLQVATVIWWHQIDGYLAVLDAQPRAPVVTLSATDFLANPLGTLTAVNEFAKLGLSPPTVQSAATGPAFQRHSKFADLEYDSTQREEERAAIESQHGEAIDLTLTWAGKLRGSPGALDDALRRLNQRSVVAGREGISEG